MDRKSALFLAKFFVIFSVLYCILWFAEIQPLNEWIAGIESWALSIERNGSTLAAGDSNFTITNYCTGLVSASILAAIVFSLRKPPLEQKIRIFMLGAAALFFINLGRVYFVLLAGIAFGGNTAETLHTISWFVMSGFIILLWYYLTKRLAKIKEFSELL
ncbi:MAG: exosortase/archaeosortase family protein [Candidatus Diapherotrites archaeon]|nr:exosortase/archaeosortase family protein [Candidatus Diapherotrites archaeon]